MNVLTTKYKNLKIHKNTQNIKKHKQIIKNHQKYIKNRKTTIKHTVKQPKNEQTTKQKGTPRVPLGYPGATPQGTLGVPRVPPGTLLIC